MAAERGGYGTEFDLQTYFLHDFTAAVACERISVGKLIFVNAMVPVAGETAGDWWGNTGAMTRIGICGQRRKLQGCLKTISASSRWCAGPDRKTPSGTRHPAYLLLIRFPNTPKAHDCFSDTKLRCGASARYSS